MSLLFLLLAADPSAEDVLKKADAQANNYKDQRFTMTMTIEGGGVKKVAKMETLQKGGAKRLIRFLAPGDVKGTAILMEGKDSMYMYMPQFQKVRRIGSHAKTQGFMDSDFSQDDMGTMSYAPLYTAAFGENTPTHYKLKLTPKPGTDPGVEGLELMVDKSNDVITQIDYIQGGKAFRRQNRGELKTFSGVLIPTVISMEDLVSHHKTTLNLEDVKINSGLADDLFTKQSLERTR